MWLDLKHICWIYNNVKINVSFNIKKLFVTYLSKFKCQLYSIYMHVNIHLAFIYTFIYIKRQI